jgi:hypothetical protein
MPLTLAVAKREVLGPEVLVLDAVLSGGESRALEYDDAAEAQPYRLP